MMANQENRASGPPPPGHEHDPVPRHEHHHATIVAGSHAAGGETAHATGYDDHHLTPEHQAEVERYKASPEARTTIRKGFEETLIQQENWRDEKSVEFPDDGRNAISAAGIEAFRRWFTKLPDDDPRVLRLLRALQRLYAGPNANTSMSPSVEDLVGRFRFDNDAEESVEFLDRLTVAVENQ
jgi:hypothetical protein